MHSDWVGLINSSSSSFGSPASTSLVFVLIFVLSFVLVCVWICVVVSVGLVVLAAT
jgi:hypothetical protein